MPASHLEGLAARLALVDWSADPAPFGRSRAALTVEYLRRAARWTRGTPRHGWPAPDIAALSGTAVRAAPPVVARVSAGPPGPLTARACVNALHLAALRDAGVPLPGLPDPYAPLLLLLERGGGFERDCSGTLLDVGPAAVPFRPPGRYGTREPLDLSPAALDALDAAAG